MKNAGIIIIAVVLSALFVIPVFSVDITSGHTADIGFGKNNLCDWDGFSVYQTYGIVDQYNRGGTSDIGLRYFRSQATGDYSKIRLTTVIDWVVAGKTYVISWNCFNYSTRLKCKMYVGDGNSLQDSSEDINNPVLDSAVLFKPSNGNYTYSFTLPETRYSDIGTLGVNLVLELSFDNPNGSGDGYIVFKDMQVVCLDDVITSALHTINQGVYNISENQSDIKDIVQEISDTIIWALTTNSDDNILADIRHNIAVWFNDYAINSPETIRGWFYKEYGERFSIAIYKLLSDTLGANVEYTTQENINDSISEYKNIESQVMQDKSAELASAMSGSVGSMQNNNAFHFIQTTLQTCIFDNPKITVYVIFALSMGLVVLVLGRKIS